jgi:hypothetical protein
VVRRFCDTRKVCKLVTSAPVLPRERVRVSWRHSVAAFVRRGVTRRRRVRVMRGRFLGMELIPRGNAFILHSFQ